MLIINISSILIFFICIIIGNIFKLYDYPNNRKIHNNPTINIGGVAIIFSYIMYIYLFDIRSEISDLILFSFYFLILGFVDDRVNLNPILRIFLQLLLAGYYLNNNDFYITKIFFEDLNFIGLNIFGEIFTIICILVVINSFNYLDGIDLNLPIISIFILTNLIYINQIFENQIYIYLISPIIIFCFFNISIFKSTKMYLGDAGSTSLGFLIAGLCVLNNYEGNQSFDTQHTIIWTLSFVVYEFLSTTISRLIRGKNIFEPGKDHIHYIINNYIPNRYYVVLVILFLNILFVLIGNEIYKQYPSYNLIFFILIFFIFFFIREFFIRKNLIMDTKK